MNLINNEALKDHYGGDYSLVKQSILIFEDSYPKTIESLKLAIKEDDLKKIELHAHTLKGMLLNFFAEDLIAHAYAIEKSAREGELNQASEKVTYIESKIPQFIIEIKDLD